MESPSHQAAMGKRKLEHLGETGKQRPPTTTVDTSKIEGWKIELASSQKGESMAKSDTPALAAGSEEGYPSFSKLRIALVVTALGVDTFLAAMDMSIIATALPTITHELRSTQGYAWVGGAYALAWAAAAPVWGALALYAGAKPMKLASSVVFLGGSALCGAAPNMSVILAGRALQGFGAAGVATLVDVTIRAMFPLSRRSTYMGIMAMVWSLASPLGLIVGGALARKTVWRWCFLLNLPLGTLAIVLLIFSLKLPGARQQSEVGEPPRGRSLDWAGILTMVPSTALLLVGLDLGGVERPWTDAAVLAALGLGVCGWIVFGVVETRYAKDPIIPVRAILRSPSNAASMALCFAHGACMAVAPYYLSVYFQAALGAPPLTAGLYMLPSFVCVSLAGPAAGIWLARTGLLLPLVLAGSMLMTVGFGMYVDFGSELSLARIVVYQTLVATGVGLNVQSSLVALRAGADTIQEIATATATVGFVGQLAGVIGVVSAGAIFEAEMRAAPEATELEAALGPARAALFAGLDVAANAYEVTELRPELRGLVRSQVATAMRMVWVAMAVVAAVGFVSTSFVRPWRLGKR
ncbi:hypothetical protein RB595_004948 [Gaeumannomyces hyphopodioides]